MEQENKFDKNTYTNQWKKKNMLSVSARYNKKFVEEFRMACKKIGKEQSELIREMMIKTIEKANE